MISFAATIAISFATAAVPVAWPVLDGLDLCGGLVMTPAAARTQARAQASVQWVFSVWRDDDDRIRQ